MKKIFRTISLITLITVFGLSVITCNSNGNKNGDETQLPDDENPAIAVLKDYITKIAGHEAFKGKIYSWDVLNEAFPDNASSNADWKTAIRPNNPWFKAIGSDFVYEGFLAARLADPNAILYYNDYNTDNPNRARLIRDMVRDVNDRYAQEYPDETRKLIEGIGMQEHHNTNVSANAVKTTINLFRPLGVKLAVTELDVLARPYSGAVEGAGKPPLDGNDLEKQAQLYGEYFKVYIENKDIIERITFWGIKDDRSWRSGAQPLLFDKDYKAKKAYDSVMEALGNNNKYEGTDILGLTPLKETIGAHFTYVGNIINPGDVTGSNITAYITHHYNSVTFENHMKPGYLVTSINNSNVTLNNEGITRAKNMVNAALAANIKVVGHTLLWHSQNPSTLNLPQKDAK